MNQPEIVEILVKRDEKIAKLEEENRQLKEGIQNLLVYVQELREEGEPADLRTIIYSIQTLLEQINKLK